MRKENVVYISNENLQVVVGEIQRDVVRILDSFCIPLHEGAMLNGVIIDDFDIKGALKQLKEKGIDEVKLVVDSAKILAKPAIIPSMNEKETLQFVKDELSQVDDNSEDVVYDFAFLSEDDKVKGASRILCVGVERKFIQSYLDVFSEEGIQIVGIEYAIDVLISLTHELSGLLDKTYAIMNVDGSNLTSVLFLDNEYSLTNRLRIFSTKGTEEYENEIMSAISQLKQFASTAEHQKQVTDIYIFGLDKANESSLFEKVRTTLNIKAQLLPRCKTIYAVQDNKDLKFDINNYVYPVGYLQRK